MYMKEILLSRIFVFTVRYLEYYTKTDTFKLANSSTVYTIYGIERTSIGTNAIFLKVMHSWFYLICVCGIPFLTLVILNAFLIRAVHLSRLKGKEINAREKHRNDTTIMLIGVIVIFLICQGPALVSRMIYAFEPGSTNNKIVFTLNEVGSFLVILNSAVNIVPYYLFGKKFRSEFWRLFCTCFFDQDELRRIVRSYSVSMDNRRNSQHNGMEMNGLGAAGGGAGGNATRYLGMAGQDYGLQRQEKQPPHLQNQQHTQQPWNQLCGESNDGSGGASQSHRLAGRTCSDEAKATTCFGNSFSAGVRGGSAAKHGRRMSDWTKRGGPRGAGCCTIRPSHTSDSVAVPLIHSTYTSLSSGGLTASNSCRDFSSNSGDLFLSAREREPLNPSPAPSVPYFPACPAPDPLGRHTGSAENSGLGAGHAQNGHAQYTSLITGPCIREPDWSAPVQ